jgi:hypothetical protein
MNISALQDMSLKYYHIFKLDSKFNGVTAHIFLVICHHRVIRPINTKLFHALNCIWLSINKINWHRSCCSLICGFLATPKQKELKEVKMQEDFTLQRVQNSNVLSESSILKWKLKVVKSNEKQKFWTMWPLMWMLLSCKLEGTCTVTVMVTIRGE